MSDDPTYLTMEEVLEAVHASLMTDVHTCMPGVITEYDKTSNRATVRPLVQFTHVLEDETEQTDTLPDLHDVPILFHGNARGRQTFPLRVGDGVFVHFASCSLAKIKVKGGITNPADDRRFHLSDAVATPAWFSFNQVPTTAPDDAVVTWAGDGITIKLGDDTADDPVALKSDLDALKTWIHTVMIVNASGATAGTANAPPSTTGATKVVAK